MAKILLVDDEPSILSVLTTLLRKQNHEVTPASSGESAVQLIRANRFDLVLTDIRMEPVNGIQVLDIVRKESPQTVVILLTGYGSIKTAVDAMKGGAFDYVTKPFKVDSLLVTIEKALAYQSVMAENAGLKAVLEAKYRLANIVAESPGMRKVCDMIERVAPTDVTVLIVGESGTGKDLVARAIHALSRRKGKPFVPVNCAAMPEPLLESEMFGHMKGSFTGASVEKTGLFEAANGGTFFLDEIGAMPLSIQAKFLRVLQDKHIRKVGGTKDFPVDVRVIAATNEPLEIKKDKNEFREDLYYRINVITIHVQPLRERKEDILPLVSCCLRRETPDGATPPNLDHATERVLEAYSWPGNVRELENAIRHALTFCKDGVIRREDLPARIVQAVGTQATEAKIAVPADIEEYRGKSLKAFLRAKEKDYIASVIDSCKGNKEVAAKSLKISLATLYRKLPEEN